MRQYPAALLALALAACSVPPMAVKEPPPGRVRSHHVILMKFKDSATPADVRRVIDAFAELPQKIPSIQRFSWTTDLDSEGRRLGFTHEFVLTFEPAYDMQDYFSHPAHIELRQLVDPLLDKVLTGGGGWAE